MADKYENPPLLWLSHLGTAPEKEAFLVTVKSSRAALRRLHELVKAKQEFTARDAISLQSYDTAAWAYRQAHMNGKQEAYEDILNLLKWAL